MGRFFNGKVKNNMDKNTLIRYGVIAGGVLLIVIILILIISNAGGKKGTITLNPEVVVEVNTEFPEKAKFFSKIEDFDLNDIEIDFADADISEVGTYKVTVTAKGRGSEQVDLKVVDTTAPSLTAKALTIAYGEPYYVEDFVDSCSDNYDKECMIEYYEGNVDQYGNKVDYSSFIDPGRYTIVIIAKDENGNISEPQTTSLVIENEGDVPDRPVECKFGGLEVSDDISYPVAVIVGDKTSQCAVDRDVWDDEDVQKPVNEFYNSDYDRLKVQLTPILEDEYPKGAKIVAYPHYVAVLNKDLTGLVGYAIYVKVYIADGDAQGSIDTTDNLKIAYYLRDDKTREYDVNAFDLAK